MAATILQLAQPFLIEQDYGKYTPESQSVWTELVSRRLPQLEEWACDEYLDGYNVIGLRSDQIPNLRDIARRLSPRTGWETTPVSGFMPPDAFFEMLTARPFPTTTWRRAAASIYYD